MNKNELSEAQQLRNEFNRTQVLSILTGHIGQMNAIGMAELYEAIYGEAWENRINDTRKLRTLITGLRREGVAICSVSSSTGGGYFLPAAGSELKGYLRNSKIRALRILARVSKIQKISLPDLLGQMRLEMEDSGHDEEA